jgi:hypothetical protein
MKTPVFVHGLDFYESAPEDYDLFSSFWMDEGVPDSCGLFDVAVCCEAIPYLQNFGVFFQSVNRHLKPGGRFILSVPNSIYAASRVDHVIQGFPRANNYFVNTVADSHMPWLPLNFYQIRFLLGMNGFGDVAVHEVDEPKPKHAWEKLVGLVSKAYIRRRLRKSRTEEEQKMDASLDRPISLWPASGPFGSQINQLISLFSFLQCWFLQIWLLLSWSFSWCRSSFLLPFSWFRTIFLRCWTSWLASTRYFLLSQFWQLRLGLRLKETPLTSR